MGRISLWFAVAVLGLAGVAARGSAQPPFPAGPAMTRPTVSPYLNLTNRNIDPAVTYYGIVRPQFVTNNALRALQQQGLQSALPVAAQTSEFGLPVTGQPAYFLNTGGYFLNSQTGMRPLATTGIAPVQVVNRPLPRTPPTAYRLTPAR